MPHFALSIPLASMPPPAVSSHRHWPHLHMLCKGPISDCMPMLATTDQGYLAGNGANKMPQQVLLWVLRVPGRMWPDKRVSGNAERPREL